MNDKTVYSMDEMMVIGFDPLPYKMMEQEGEFKATLDFKRWGKSRTWLHIFLLKE